MPDRTGIFLGWSVNLSNFLGLGVEAGASPMYPQKMRVPPPPPGISSQLRKKSKTGTAVNDYFGTVTYNTALILSNAGTKYIKDIQMFLLNIAFISRLLDTYFHFKNEIKAIFNRNM